MIEILNKRSRKLEKFLQKNNISFIDLFSMPEEIGIYMKLYLYKTPNKEIIKNKLIELGKDRSISIIFFLPFSGHISFGTSEMTDNKIINNLNLLPYV